MSPVFVVLLSGAAMLVLAMGLRQSFGVFLVPVSVDLETGRAAFALAIALQNLLMGAVQPFVGALADRIGAAPVAVVGGILYALALLAASMISSAIGLNLTIGVMIGLALSACTYVTILGAVARVVPIERRGQAFGLCTAAGSFGMFALVPLAQTLMDQLGWREALLWLAALASLIVIVAAGFKPADRRIESHRMDLPLGRVLSAARRHRGYLLLNAGFFVCGFHVAFVATHLPAFLRDSGIDGQVNAWSLALIGLFNMLGSYWFGRQGDFYRQKYVLSALYFARAVIIAGFFLLPVTSITALIFGAAIGFVWLGTVPLTSGVVARVFGVRYLSTLYGVVFLSHQVGAFLGAWGGGAAYDWLGSYDLVWIVAIGLALMATMVHFAIDDAPVRLAPNSANA